MSRSGTGRPARPDEIPVLSNDPDFGVVTVEIPPVGETTPSLLPAEESRRSRPTKQAKEAPAADDDPAPQAETQAPPSSPLGRDSSGRDRETPDGEAPEDSGCNDGGRHGPRGDQPVVVAAIRPIDGSGSNEAYEDWGAVDQHLLRLADAGFDDGIGSLAEADRPNPRAVSNAVAAQEGDEPNSFGISDLFWAWGQFIDHDLDLTEAGNSELAPIAVPTGDPAFDPDSEGGAFIPFFRVDPVEGSGETTPREYVNEITAFIDASMVYGSDAETAAALRGDGGTLLLDEEGFLVATEDGVLAGDVRAAENVALTSLHTLFAREHNWWVEKLAERDPELSDEELYWAARQRVEAEIQAVTYNEFLPILLGAEAIEAYDGYDPTVDPGITVEFSTAAYRFGHSLLSSNLLRLEEDGESIAAGALALRDAFFVPGEIAENGGIAALLRGLAGSTAQELDTQVVEDVRSFLFGEPGDGGLDLASINIQRGRDLGVASYNDLREALGLERADSFADVTADSGLAQILEDLYGDVDLLDAWVGGLAEDPFGEGILGELFHTVVLDQFLRVRDGDPYWSRGSELPDKTLDKLWSTTLADIVERNGDVEAIQEQVFYAYTRQGGTEGDDVLEGGEERDLLLGLGGDDSLVGNGGDDQLEGGEGADSLFGGSGDDLLKGDDGPDRFVFDLSQDSGGDLILDFGPDDVLVLSDLLDGFDTLAGLDSLLAQAEGFAVSQSGGKDGDVVVSFGQGGGSATLVGIGNDTPVDSFQDLSESILLELQGA